jgi:16S rRNA (uracil1498-N3)-methyltransferase
VRRRFFVEQFTDDRALMEGEAAHHLGRVLRAQAGQVYELSDGFRVRLGRVEKVTRDEVEFALLEEVPSHQPEVQSTLLLAIVKFDAFEWALEKATELGVTTIVPVAAARSVRVPVLLDATRTADAFRAIDAELKTLLSERASATSLKEILSGAQVKSAALAIGPEGGWTDEEFADAAAAGFREVSMGKMILRTETAVTAALACLNFALEI